MNIWVKLCTCIWSSCQQNWLTEHVLSKLLPPLQLCLHTEIKPTVVIPWWRLSQTGLGTGGVRQSEVSIVENMVLSREQWVATNVSISLKAGQCTQWWGPGSFRFPINANPIVKPCTSNATARQKIFRQWHYLEKFFFLAAFGSSLMFSLGWGQWKESAGCNKSLAVFGQCPRGLLYMAQPVLMVERELWVLVVVGLNRGYKIINVMSFFSN